MKQSTHRISTRWLRGFSLIEVVVAMGVLSVAVLSSVALLGRSAGMRSDVVIDTHAPMIIDTLTGELSMVIESETVTPTSASNDRRMTQPALPLDVPTLQTSAGERLVLLFSAEGAPLGVVGENEWQQGTNADDGAILALCEGVADVKNPSLIRAVMTLTHPAVAPLDSRRQKSYPFVIAARDR